ncbi:MAG TPA: UDP-N-acetylmuramoyl-L-alanyl-D-glutamate--2,6-diaminopimelate ligase [Woeseiaceae bacterium]
MNLQPQLNLAQLLTGIAVAPPIPITGLQTDSRRIERGNVFLACQGATAHGLAFMDQAVMAGAAAIVWDGNPAAFRNAMKSPLPIVGVPGLGNRLGELANRWFDEPSRHVTVSGITGTNGKTTIAWLIAQCMRRIKRQCGYIGTLGDTLDGANGNPLPASADSAAMTTPACIDLHGKIAGFRVQGAGFLALEVSSHALHQNRIDGVHFDSALFSNLSRDHIDYHGSMYSYGETKAAFLLRQDIRHRVVNIDSTFGRNLAARCGDDVTVVSTDAPLPRRARSQVTLTPLQTDGQGTVVNAETSWGSAEFHLPLVGRFNVGNAALVLGQLLGWDVPIADAAHALSQATPPPGRMQRVLVSREQAGPAVYVDYAHTPAGLEAVLQSLREHCGGELWCVFGCGGDRDRGKRPLMGEVVTRLADHAVVTNDNPRNEPPGEIIAATLAGMDRRAQAIEDRATAIAYAIDNASARDVVLIAGKGHENYQLIGGRRLPFSDYQAARTSLEARRGAAAGKQ